MPIDKQKLGAYLQRRTIEPDVDFRTTMYGVRDINPDEAAEAQRLAQKYGVPQDTAQRRLSALKKREAWDSMDFETLSRTNPALREYLSVPGNAALMHDEVGSLTWTADKFRSLGATAVQFPSDIIGGTGEQLRGMGAASARSAAEIRKAGFRNDIFSRTIDEAVAGSLYLTGDILDFSSDEGLDKAADFIRPPKEREGFTDQVVSGLGQLAAQIYLAAKNPASIVPVLLAQGAEMQGDRLDEKGIEDEYTRLQATTAGGTITAATNLPVLNFIKRIPGIGPIVDKLPKAFQNKWVDMTIDVSAAAVAEAGQEVLEDFLHDAVAYAIYDPDVEFLKTYKETAAVSGTVGGIARAFILALAGGGRAGRSVRSAQRSTQDADEIKEFKDNLAQMKLAERSPDKFAEMAEVLNVDEKDMRLDASLTEELYQSGVDLEKFFEAVPEAREQFEQADLAGADIVLPMDKVLAAMVQDKTGGLDILTDFMKPDADAPTAREAKSYEDPESFTERVRFIMEEVAAQQQDMEGEQAGRTMAQEIENKIYDNLINPDVMGEKVRTPEAARTEARITGAMVETLLREEGAAAGPELQRIFGENFMVQGPVAQQRGAAEGQGEQTAPESAQRGFELFQDYPNLIRRPMTLRGFIRKSGGMRDVDGDLRAMDLHKNNKFKGVINSKGLHPDRMREMAEEAGYIKSKKQDETTSIADLYDAIAQEMAGNDVYRESDADLVDKYQSRLKAMEESGEYQAISDQIAEYGNTIGVSLTENETRDIALLMNEGYDIEDATEIALTKAGAEYEADASEREGKNPAAEGFDIPFEDLQPRPRSAADSQKSRGDKRASIKRVGPTGEILPLSAEEGTVILSLFESADFTSWFHENGHFMLDVVMRRVARSEAATDRIKNDWMATLKFLGVEVVEGQSPYDVEFTREQHEKFAQGFERYLFEGKAPSRELASTFERIKMWFLGVYKRLGPNAKISDEMRGVFDRLLATDEAIEAWRNDPVVKPNPQTSEMLSPAQNEQYKAQLADDMRRMKHKLFIKALREKRREGTQWWKEESEKTRKEVEEAMRAEPLYRLTHFLQTGENFNGEKQTEGPHKLDESLLAEAIGKERLKDMPRGIRAKKGEGLDPQIAADLFGFGSVREMADALAGAQPFAREAVKRTDDLMIQRHGDMLNDGTIEQRALEMVMAETTGPDGIILQSLSEKTGVEYPVDGDFKLAAAAAIGRMKIDDAIKPEKYYKAALKAEREYGKALAKKHYEAAADAKRKVILNKHLYRFSRDARENADKALKRFQKLSRAPAKGKRPAIDPAYHEKIWDVLDQYSLGPRMSAAKSERILRKQQFLNMKEMQAWMEGEEREAKVALLLPPELRSAQEKIHYRDLTVNEFEGLRDLVINLETQGRRKQDYIIEGKKQDMQRLTVEMMETAEGNVEALPVSLNEQAERRKLGNQPGRIAKAIDAISTKTQTLMAKLDGGDEDGVWTRTIYEPAQLAEIRKNVRLREEYDRWRAVVDQYYRDEPNGFLQSDIGVTDPSSGQPITHEMMLSAALHQGSEDNKTKFAEGYKKTRGWTQDFIDDSILSKMRRRDWEFVMATRDYLNSFWAETSAVERRRFGWPPEKIDPLPDQEYTTVDGEKITVRGGYMRIMYDRHQDAQAMDHSVEQTFEDMVIGKSSRAHTRRGSMEERVSGVRRPIRLDLGVIHEHVAEQVGIITMSETVENISKVLNTPRIKQVLKERIGDENRLLLDSWLQDLAVGGQMAGSTVTNYLRAMRSNYTVGRLALKPLTAILQYSGLAQSTADLGPKWMGIGLSRFFSQGNPYIIIREVQDKSEFMRERRFTLTRDLALVMKEYQAKGKAFMDEASALSLLPMMKVQEQVDTITWLAAYEKALGEGRADDRAIRIADMAVARLQASGLVSDQAAIERGTLSQAVQRQEMVKASTMFYSYFNAKYNVLKNAHVKYNSGKITFVDLAGTYFMAIMVEGLLSVFLMGQMKLDLDDDDEVTAPEIAAAVAWETFAQGGAMIPFGRTIVGGMDGFTGQAAYEKQLTGLGSLAGRIGQRAYQGLDYAFTGEYDGKINPYSDARLVVDAINIVAPIPAGLTNQILRAMEKRDKGEEVDWMDWITYRE